MIKKIIFLILLALTIFSFGCNVYDELIDAAIVDQAQTEDTTTTTSDTTTTTTTTATDTASLVLAPTNTAFSAIIPSAPN
jgi:hypothetical protein